VEKRGESLEAQVFEGPQGAVEKEGGFQRLLSKGVFSTGTFSFSTGFVEKEGAKKRTPGDVNGGR